MREPILLTPGPLTTSLATKAAMLSDWGSWDSAFSAMTASVCRQLVAIAGAQATHVCVPLQGSGTFAVEAAVGNLVPRGGKLLVLVNGVYGKRMARIAGAIGRQVAVYEVADDAWHEPAEVAARLEADPTISHVGVIQCETSTGILNPVAAIANVVAIAGRRLSWGNKAVVGLSLGAHDHAAGAARAPKARERERHALERLVDVPLRVVDELLHVTPRAPAGTPRATSCTRTARACRRRRPGRSAAARRGSPASPRNSRG